MSLPIYQRVAVTDAGDIIPGAEYTVINENTGVAAPIYSDRTGATLLTAPYFADSAGTIQFFIAQGTTFRVAASGGVGTYTDRYVYGVAEAVLVQADGNVGIGTSSPAAELDVDGVIKARSRFLADTGAGPNYGYQFSGDGNTGMYSDGADTLQFSTSGGERLRIDNSGNLLVGTTSVTVASQTGTTQGVRIAGADNIQVASTGVSAYFNKLSTDGSIVEFRKSGATVGSIGVNSGTYPYIGGNAGGSGDVFLVFISNTTQSIRPSTSTGSGRDGVINLGASNARFNNIYATNGTIQTSDRNEKQDILEITTAEHNVAKACKGLLRSFRWKSVVEKKGDDARIHFGIIAQDLQDAFTAEGLDAGRYAMFMSDTWWETQTEVEAVEAVEGVEFVQAVEASEALYSEDGELVSEAVEAVEGVEGVEAIEASEAYTRTDTFETLEEAPEGATERTRLGVRYSELLAFIIAAL